MAIKEKDIKLLWGRSGNRCAICRKEVSFDSKYATASFPLGEQAHIVAEEENGPRGRSILSIDERNSYHNLILLCPTHHREIDKDVESYPMEKLHMLKAQHELWVQSTLSEHIDTQDVAENAIYASLIDSAVENCRLRDWQAWTSWALSTDAKWDLSAPTRLETFTHKVLAAPWPRKLDELERALKTLAHIINHALRVFMRHADRVEDAYVAVKFYNNIQGWNPVEYDKQHAAWGVWIDECHRLIIESTKAANWLADVVRRDINPMFFAIEGKFLVTTGPHADFSYRTSLHEFSPEERALLPEAFVKELSKKESGDEALGNP